MFITATQNTQASPKEIKKENANEKDFDYVSFKVILLENRIICFKK